MNGSEKFKTSKVDAKFEIAKILKSVANKVTNNSKSNFSAIFISVFDLSL